MNDKARLAIGKGFELPLEAVTQTFAILATRDEVAEATGFSVAISHVDNTISNLRTLELITGGRNDLKATDEFFQ